jgi:hypothetical protein
VKCFRDAGRIDARTEGRANKETARGCEESRSNEKTIHTTMAAGTTIPQLMRAVSDWRFDKSCWCSRRADGHRHFADRNRDVVYVIEEIGLPPDPHWTILSEPS